MFNRQEIIFLFWKLVITINKKLEKRNVKGKLFSVQRDRICIFSFSPGKTSNMPLGNIENIEKLCKHYPYLVGK